MYNSNLLEDYQNGPKNDSIKKKIYYETNSPEKQLLYNSRIH